MNRWIEFKKAGLSSRHFIEGTRSIDWVEAKGLGIWDLNIFKAIRNLFN